MRLIVQWRSDSDGAGQWRRARLGTRSDKATSTSCNKALRRVLCRPFRAAGSSPPALPIPLWNALAEFAGFSFGLCAFSLHSAAPPDAPRTDATDKGLPASVRFKASPVEFVGSAERTRRGPSQYKPQVAAAQDSS